MIVAGGARVSFAGDTAYVPFFGDVRRRFGPIDLALLPIGAYGPRWFMRSVHMDPAEAVQAHRALEEACRAQGVEPGRFRTLGFGASLRV